MLTDNFSRSEFACKCGCGLDTVDFALLTLLQWLRTETGKRVTIISGHRCKHHNEKVGGTENSQHLLGRAADIFVHGIDPGEVYMLLSARFGNRISLGYYPTDRFVHVDTRDPGGARWRE